MSRLSKVEKCNTWCGYRSSANCLYDCNTDNPDGRSIDKIEPDGFPKWCPGMPEDIVAKYQAALEQLSREGDCPFRLRNHVNYEGFSCWEECRGNKKDTVLSCWDKYFAEEIARNAETEEAK